MWECVKQLILWVISCNDHNPGSWGEWLLSLATCILRLMVLAGLLLIVWYLWAKLGVKIPWPMR